MGANVCTLDKSEKHLYHSTVMNPYLKSFSDPSGILTNLVVVTLATEPSSTTRKAWRAMSALPSPNHSPRNSAPSFSSLRSRKVDFPTRPEDLALNHKSLNDNQN